MLLKRWLYFYSTPTACPSSTDSTPAASSCCKLDQLAATDLNWMWPVLIASLQMWRTDNWGQSPSNFFFLGVGVRRGSANTCVVCVGRQVGSEPPPAAQPAELDAQEKKKRTEYCALLPWGRGRAEFVPLRQELLSLSLGHTRLHQFIIDANLFRADWWQNFLPFTELVLSFIKGPKLPAN